MARYDGELIAAEEVAFDLGDLARTADGSVEADRAKRLAMARLLSAAEGWQAAAAALDGAFAGSVGEAGLTGRKQR